MASKRGNPVARVGNYVQEVDSTGMDESMKSTMFGTVLDKTEKNFLKNNPGSTSAMKAVRKARKANKQPPVKE